MINDDQDAPKTARQIGHPKTQQRISQVVRNTTNQFSTQIPSVHTSSL